MHGFQPHLSPTQGSNLESNIAVGINLQLLKIVSNSFTHIAVVITSNKL